MNKSRIYFSLQVYRGEWQELHVYKKHRQVMSHLKNLRGDYLHETYRVVARQVLTIS